MKSFFWVFLCFCFFFVFVFFFVLFFFVFWRVEGSGEVARRATSLGPKPSFFFIFCFFGGLKGQERWPKGPPHLALNPPYLFFLLFFLFFLLFLSFLCFLLEKPCFPPKKGIFCLFSVFLFFPPLTFLASLFSVFLSLSLLLLLSVFLPSCFFVFFLFLVFVFFHLFSLLLFHDKSNMKILNNNFFVSSFWFLVYFIIIFVFSWFWVMFFVQHHCFWYQKTQVEKKTPILGQQGGGNITFCFMNLCFAKCEKLSFLGGIFSIFGCLSKNTLT